MSDIVKLIIKLPKDIYEKCKDLWFYDAETLEGAVAQGTPLDSNDSDYAEAQAYFDGESFGWDEGRKALIEELKAKIIALPKTYPFTNHIDTYVKEDDVLQIFDRIGKESEE